jgi:hypothetical protein
MSAACTLSMVAFGERACLEADGLTVLQKLVLGSRCHRQTVEDFCSRMIEARAP